VSAVLVVSSITVHHWHVTEPVMAAGQHQPVSVWVLLSTRPSGLPATFTAIDRCSGPKQTNELKE
jgi:hypothetical protein